MKCRKVKEELVLLLREGEEGQDLTIAIRRHVSVCPHCARRAEQNRKMVTIVRERCARRSAPTSLRARILARLQKPTGDS